MKMKKTHKIILLVLMIALVSVLGVGCKKTSQNGKESNSEEKGKVEQLLSFDSFEEITGTEIFLSGLFGETAVNTDKKFVTEGKASWMVKPEGDYGNPYSYDAKPSFKMKCVDTTFKSSDFTYYDNLKMDVYNASDEERHIEWTFTTKNYKDATVDVAVEEFTLKPNTWTTCEFDFSSSAYTYYYTLDTVEYMKVTFVEHKESKDEEPTALYLDNLRAERADTKHEIQSFDYALSDGIDMEKDTDLYIFEEVASAWNHMGLSRVAYEDTSLKDVDDTLGEYALLGEAQGTRCAWPRFVLPFEKTYPEGTVISYRVYVEVDEEVARGKTFKAAGNTDVDGPLRFLGGDCPYNTWVNVYAVLQRASNGVSIYLNLDDYSSPLGASELGETPARIYMDNFSIMDKEDVQAGGFEGEVVLITPSNVKQNIYDLGMLKKGRSYSFDFKVEPKQPYTIHIYGNVTNTEYFAQLYQGVGGTASFDMKEDEPVRVLVTYLGEGNWKENKITLSNFTERSAQTNISADGTVTLKNEAGAKQLIYRPGTVYPKGKAVSFNLKVSPSQNFFTVHVYGDKTGTEYFAQAYNGEGGIVSFDMKADEEVYILITFEEGKDHSKNVVTLSNFRVTDAQIIVGTDGTVTLKNEAGAKQLIYRPETTYKKGKVVSFEFKVTPDQDFFTVHVYGEKTNIEYFARSYNEESGIVSFDMQADEQIRIMVTFEDDQDIRKNVVTLSAFKVTDAQTVVGADGTITMKNEAGAQQLIYRPTEVYKEGHTVSFDFEVTPDQNFYTLHVYGESSNIEYFARAYSEESGNVSFDMKEDEEVYILITFEEGKDHSKNVVTLSNFKVTEPQIVIGDDGTITMKNAAGANQLAYYPQDVYSKGSQITFNVTISPAQNFFAVHVYGLTTGTEYHAKAYNGDSGKVAFDMEAEEKIYVLITYYDADKNWQDNVAILSDFKVIEAQTVVGADGTITIKNAAGNQQIVYYPEVDYASGTAISFNLNITPVQEYFTVHVIGETSGTNYFAKAYNGADATVTFTMGATEKIRIIVTYYNEGAYNENVATIRNLVTGNCIKSGTYDDSRWSNHIAITVGKNYDLTFDFEVLPEAVGDYNILFFNNDTHTSTKTYSATTGGKQSFTIQAIPASTTGTIYFRIDPPSSMSGTDTEQTWVLSNLKQTVR